MQKKMRSLSMVATIDDDSVASVAAEVTCRSVSASWFKDGSLLDELASEHLATFSRLLGGTLKLTIGRRIRWGSACTGSAGDLVVAKAVALALQDATIHYMFSCEKTRRSNNGLTTPTSS